MNQESCTATEQRKYFSISIDGKTYVGTLTEKKLLNNKTSVGNYDTGLKIAS